jgi:hypothetical protein
MKYHKINWDWRPEVVGTTNEVFQAELIEKKFDNRQNYQDIMDFFDSKTFWSRNHDEIKGLNFEYIRLLKKSKLTDIISFRPHFLGVSFLINSKTKRLLDGFSIANSRFFKARVYSFDGKLIDDDFFVVYTSYYGFDSIDFPNSLFYSGDNKLGDRVYHQFANHKGWEDYWDSPNHEFVKAEKIVVAGDDFDDIIRTRLGGPFVSERLLARWTSFGITGFIKNDDQILEFG